MLGIICGLESEAKIARKIAFADVACAAAQPLKARALARELVVRGASCLISFGIAGSLSSQINIGDLIIGNNLISASMRWPCDPMWINHLTTLMPHTKTGDCYGSEKLIGSVAAKQTLHQSTGCVCVDMESQCAAEVAAEANIPLVIIRTICDDAAMNVPPLVMAAVKPDGTIDVWGAIGSFIRQPSQIGAVFDIMRGTQSALKSLGKTVPFITAPSH